MNTEGMKILSMMDAVTVVPEELVEGMEDDDAHDHAEAHNEEAHHDHEEAIVYDEHVWTAPENAVLIVRAITEALCGADPVNAAYYRENSRAYTGSLARLDSGFKAAAGGAARNTLVFGDRFPFRYLADAYGLEYYAAFPGCAAETEPSAATVAFLINKIKAEQIPVVFHIELSNERMADIIAAETGAKKLLLHACHTISKSDFDAGKSYLSLMESNVENLREALR
jgi:zinc transport system substrate-binding protein